MLSAMSAIVGIRKSGIVKRDWCDVTDGGASTRRRFIRNLEMMTVLKLQQNRSDQPKRTAASNDRQAVTYAISMPLIRCRIDGAEG